jgi:hypothetical protein
MSVKLKFKKRLPNEKFGSSAMRHSTGPNFKIEYLGEFETEFVNNLGL